jgi:hypothetical protein
VSTIFRHWAFIIIIAASGVFCFTALPTRTLWQDEGETAVLAQSILRTAIPKALNGPNLILQDTIGYDSSYRWTFHPWAQFYLAAVSLKLLGQTTFAARAPFALCGLLAIALTYVFAHRNFKSKSTAALAALLLATSATFIIHSRQCRYYALGALTCLLVVVVFIELFKRPTWRWALALALALTAQFYTDFGTLIAITPGLLIAIFINRPGKKHLLAIVLSTAVTILLIAPGLILHYARITSSPEHNQHFLRLLLVHLWYLDGWFIPVLLLAPAGLTVLLLRLKTRKPLTQQTITAMTVALVILSAFTIMACAVPYPHIRYLISQMPLAKLLMALILIKGYQSIRSRVIPLLYARAILTFAVVIVIFTNIPAWPLHYIIIKNVTSGIFKSKPLARDDLFGFLFYELTGDFICPNRVTLNVVNDLTEPNEWATVNYGDLPLMFYRPAMIITTGRKKLNLSENPQTFPDIIIERSFPNPNFKRYVKDILARCDYILIEIPVPAMTWGNIPEPREHRYRTPKQLAPFRVFLRADHKQRLAKIPQTPENLTTRWYRQPIWNLVPRD